MTASTSSLSPQLQEESDVQWRETILNGLSKVMTAQLDFRHDLDVLNGRVITKADVEGIISDSFMTRQEFKEQREKDLLLWRKSTRWFYTVLTGCGCSVVGGMLLTSLISAGVVWAVFQFWLH